MVNTPKKITPRTTYTQRKCSTCSGTGYVGKGAQEKKCPAGCKNGTVTIATL